MKINLVFNKLVLIILGIIIAYVLYINIKFVINTDINILLIAIPTFIIFGIMFIIHKYSFNFITLVFFIFSISFLLCFIVSQFTKTTNLTILNCVYMSTINTLIFLIATVVTKNIKAGAFSAYAYMFYPAKYFYATITDNHNLSILLFLLSVYISLRFGLKKFIVIIISLVLIIIANFISLIGTIHIVALLLYLFYTYLSNNNIKIGLSKAFRLSILILILYFAGNIILNQVIKLNHWQLELNIISEFISDITKNPINFFINKNINLYTLLEHTDLVSQIDNFYYLVILILSFLSILLMLINNCNKITYINLILICFALIQVENIDRSYFIVYLFIIISMFQKYLKIKSKRTS